MSTISQSAAMPRARTAIPGLDPEPYWDDEGRWEWIAENAYYRAERRGFLPGFEITDWLEAERELELAEHTGPMAQS